MGILVYFALESLRMTQENKIKQLISHIPGTTVAVAE